MNKSNRIDERGITLIEIIIVVVIVGVLPTLTASYLQTILKNMELGAQTRELYGHFQRAKIEAVKRNQNFLIAFDLTGNGTYLVFIDFNCDRVANSGDEILARVTIPAGEKLMDANLGGTRVGGFTPRRRPSGGMGRVVLRCLHSGKELTLTTSLGGYVHVK